MEVPLALGGNEHETHNQEKAESCSATGQEALAAHPPLEAPAARS